MRTWRSRLLLPSEAVAQVADDELGAADHLIEAFSALLEEDRD
jgi:hypothetical protein